MNNLEQQIEKAIINGQKSILYNDKVINIPKGQTCGTITQQKTYARLKAIKMVQTLNA